MSEASTVSRFKKGRKTFEVKQNRGSFELYVDGSKLDSFKSREEANKAAKEFSKMMG